MALNCREVLSAFGLHTSSCHRQSCRYEAARRHAEMLHKLSLENFQHQNSSETDRGHITTILEHDGEDDDDAKHIRPDQAGLSFTDTARSMLDEYDLSKGLTTEDSMGSQRNLPKVRTTRTVDHAVQVAIAGNRRNSLPDLGSRRPLRPRTAVRKDSFGSVRLDGQVWPAGCPFLLSTSNNCHQACSWSDFLVSVSALYEP